MSNFYNVNEIKEIFKEYKSLEKSSITESEFSFFCETMSQLKKDIVDKIKYFTKFSKIPVYIFPGSRIDLGLKCKKNFKISVLTLR